MGEGCRGNADFNRYLERYCKTYGYTAQEAVTHALVMEVLKYYEDPEG